MPAKYFICIRSRLDGSHTIHREDCPFLPESGKRILLGTFKSVSDAAREAVRHFRRQNSCPFCSKVHNEIKGKEFTLRQTDHDLISSALKIKTPWVNMLFCSLS